MFVATNFMVMYCCIKLKSAIRQTNCGCILKNLQSSLGSYMYPALACVNFQWYTRATKINLYCGGDGGTCMYMYVRIIKCSMWLGKCVIFMSILLEIWPVKVSVTVQVKKSSHSVYVELALYVSTVTVFTPFKNRFLEPYRSTNLHF